MRRRHFLSASLGALALQDRGRGGELYEEALYDSSPYRVEQWRGLSAYIESLPPASLPALPGEDEVSQDPAAALRKCIGFPAPGLNLQKGPHILPVGEDAHALYYRVWNTIHGSMQAYGLLLVPKAIRGKAPLVIALHGNIGYPELALFRGGANYHDMIRGPLREGYVTFAPLVVTAPANDERYGSPIPKDVRQQLDFAARRKGTTLWAIEIRKIQLSMEALLAHPSVDDSRIAMVGLSLGGFYTLRTTLLEPRIKAAVASCQPDVYAWRDRSSTGQFPETRDISNAQCALGIAPRPLQLQYGLQDPLAKIDAARRTRRELSELATKHGAAMPGLDYQEFEGKHEFRGNIAWTFLRKHLSPGG